MASPLVPKALCVGLRSWHRASGAGSRPGLRLPSAAPAAGSAPTSPPADWCWPPARGLGADCHGLCPGHGVVPTAASELRGSAQALDHGARTCLAEAGDLSGASPEQGLRRAASHLGGVEPNHHDRPHAALPQPSMNHSQTPSELDFVQSPAQAVHGVPRWSSNTLDSAVDLQLRIMACRRHPAGMVWGGCFGPVSRSGTGRD